MSRHLIFSTLYSSISHNLLKSRISNIAHNAFREKDGNVRYTHIKVTRPKWYFTRDIIGGRDNMDTADNILEMIESLIDNINFGLWNGQVIGIPMGTNCAPVLVDLYSYKDKFQTICMIRSDHRRLTRSFNLCCEYINDLIVLNNKSFRFISLRYISIAASC